MTVAPDSCCVAALQVLGGVLAGLVGLSTAMSAHAMDLRDDRCAGGGDRRWSTSLLSG